MKQSVSRRNGRAISTRWSRLAPWIPLALSLVVFLGGFASLSTVLGTPPADVGEAWQPPLQQERQAANPYDGTITPGDESVAPGEAEPPQPQDAPEAEVAQQPDSVQPPQTAQRAEQPDPVVEEQEREQSGQGAVPADGRQAHVIHHTAYREEPVYRTVHHQASSARELTVGGESRIEWTSCPVCGQRHDNAYNERVVDHLVGVACAACGTRHEAAYDETVYY